MLRIKLFTKIRDLWRFLSNSRAQSYYMQKHFTVQAKALLHAFQFYCKNVDFINYIYH